jgi:hypothetical protein
MEVSGHDGAGDFALEARVEASAARVSSVWQQCPRCGAKWADIAWDAESDHEFLLVECRNRHLFRADEQFWLFDYDGSGVYVPSEETETEVSAHAG